MVKTLYFEVEDSFHKSRLDDYLFNQIPHLSRMYLRYLIAEGKCEVNGELQNTGYRLSKNDFIEIEFKDDKGRASGKRLYLQLKSGDSYLTTRKRDGAEVFQIKHERWATYWQQQAYPVLLVIRTSDGEIRWMDVSEYQRRLPQPVKQIVFSGERFDVMSVRRWRERMMLP